MRRRAPRLLLLTPVDPDALDLPPLLPGLRGVADGIVLRWPALSTRELCLRAAALLARPDRPPLLVSDRVDVALALRADGVQLRDDGLPPATLRALLPDLWIGVSRHGGEGLRASEGADWALLSPFHASASKPGTPPLGERAWAALAAESPVPVLALGGVGAAEVPRCRAAGAWGVAALSAVFGDPDPVVAARRLRAALDRS